MDRVYKRTKSITRIFKKVRYTQCLTCGRSLRIMTNKHSGYCHFCYQAQYKLNRKRVSEARKDTIRKLMRDRPLVTTHEAQWMSADKFADFVTAVCKGKKQLTRVY